MTTEFDSVFQRLRSILQRNAGTLAASEDTATRYCLVGPVGPATLQAWGGKMRSPTMPVAWVEVGKAYVSFHHMAFYGSAKLNDAMSKNLKKRMHGKTCFNFRELDDELFAELEQLAIRGFQGMKAAGFVR